MSIDMTNRERRGSEPAIPEQLDELLTEAQLIALQKAEKIGYGLRFIRRQGKRGESFAVLANKAGNHIGLLNQNGHLSLDFNPKLRA